MVVSGQVNGISTQNDSWFEFRKLGKKYRRSAWGAETRIPQIIRALPSSKRVSETKAE